MSRIELDDYERGVVERARETLAASEAMWTTDAPEGRSSQDMAGMLGRLEVVVSGLLHIIDGDQEGRS